MEWAASIKKGLNLRLVVFFLLLLGGAVFVGWHAIHNAKKQDEQFYRNLVKLEAKTIERQLWVLETYSETLTKVDNVQLFMKLMASGSGKAMEYGSHIKKHLIQLASRPSISAVYLMDINGNCILSSRDSFMGHNYGFRPYFKDALAKGHGFYVAVGVTSGALGFYYSLRINDENNKPIGVAVFKLKRTFFDVDGEENEKDIQDILSVPFSALATRDGVIIGPHDELFVLSGPSEEFKQQLKKSRQFPPAALKGLGFNEGAWKTVIAKGYAKEKRLVDGKSYWLFTVPLRQKYLVYFHSIPDKLFQAQFLNVSRPVIILALLLLVAMGIMLFFYCLLQWRHQELKTVYQEIENERKEYRRLLKRYTSILETASEGFVIMEPETYIILEVNPAFCAILGYSSEELIGRPFFDLLEDECRERLVSLDQEGREPKCTGNICLITKDCDKRQVTICRDTIVDKETGRDIDFAFLTDITEYVKSRAETNKLFMAVEQSVHSVVITNERGDIEYVNPAFCQVTGYTKDEVLGHNPRVLKSGKHDAAFYRDMWKTILNGRVWKNEICNKKKDGSLFWEWATIVPVKNDQNKITNFIAIKEDITEWKKLHSKLDDLASELNLIVENVGIGIVYIRQSKILRLNQETARIFRATSEEMVGKNVRIFFPDQKLFDAFYDEMLKTIGEKGIYTREMQMVRADGELGWFRLTGKALDPKDVPAGSIWIVEDITQRKEMEAVIARKDRILQEIGYVSRQFLICDKWMDAIAGVLSHLGRAAEMQSAFLYKYKGGGLREIYTWSIDNHFSGRMKSFLEKTFAAWSDKLLKDGIWLSSDYLAAHDIGLNFTIIFPVLVEENLWGVMGFETKDSQQNLSKAEIAALYYAISVLASAIGRERSEAAKAIEEIRLSTIVQNAYSIILRIDKEGTVTFINRFGLNFFGYKSYELVGRKVVGSILLPDSSFAKDFKELLKGFRENGLGYLNYEIQNITKDGVPVWVYWSYSPIRDSEGNVIEILCIGHDVSASKELEERLIKARMVAEETSRAKSRFLANMSHEIRTPLHAIIGMARLAKKTARGEIKQYITNILTGANMLLSIINDILDLSKIDAAQMKLEEMSFDIREVMEETVQLLASRAHKKYLDILCQVSSDMPELVKGDKFRLQQVFFNLVGNAIKFTDKGHVILKGYVEAVEGNDAIFHFEVIDTGVGIPEEKQAAIFDAFTQADNSVTRRFGGTGLGLTLCKKLVQLMRGNIWVDSKEGKGSIFHFTARFKIAQLEYRPKALLDFDPAAAVILVADINPISRHIVSEGLREFGFPVIEAKNAKDAIAALNGKDENPDEVKVVILDENIMEPTLLAQFESMEGNYPPLILLCRVLAESIYEDRILNVKRYLLKPVTRRTLLNTIREIIVEPKSNDNDFGEDLAEKKEEAKMPLKILLAEDYFLNQQLAAVMIEQAGHDMKVAENGLEVLSMLAREKFDLILMDIQMPHLDGYSTARIIRAIESRSVIDAELDPSLIERLKAMLSGGHIPIIAMTAHAFPEDMEKCFEAGMDDYLAKPFSEEDLNKVLTKITPLLAGPGGKDPPVEKPVIEVVQNCLKEKYGLSGEKREEMMQAISISLKGAFEQYKKAIARQELDNISRAAHKLKGTLLSFGLEEWAEKALEMERKGRLGEKEFPYEETFREIYEYLAPLLKK